MSNLEAVLAEKRAIAELEPLKLDGSRAPLMPEVTCSYRDRGARIQDR